MRLLADAAEGPMRSLVAAGLLYIFRHSKFPPDFGEFL